MAVAKGAGWVTQLARTRWRRPRGTAPGHLIPPHGQPSDARASPDGIRPSLDRLARLRHLLDHSHGLKRWSTTSRGTRCGASLLCSCSSLPLCLRYAPCMTGITPMMSANRTRYQGTTCKGGRAECKHATPKKKHTRALKTQRRRGLPRTQPNNARAAIVSYQLGVGMVGRSHAHTRSLSMEGRSR